MADTGQLLEDGWGTTTTWFNKQKDDIVEYWTDVGTDIGQGLTETGQLVQDGWGTTTTWFEDQANMVVGFWSDVGTDIANDFDTGTTWIADGFADAMDYAADVPDKLADNFAGMRESIADRAGDIGAGISDAFAGVGKAIEELFPTVDFDKLWENMGSMSSSAVAGLVDIFNIPIDMMKSSYNGLLAMISEKQLIPGYTIAERGGWIDNKMMGTWPAEAIGWDPVKTPKIGTPFQLSSNTAADFVFRPGQPAQRFSAEDTLVGYKGEIADFSPLIEGQKQIATRQSQENTQIINAVHKNNELLMTMISTLQQGIPVRKSE